MWTQLSGLVFLSSLSYGALFVFAGVVFLRRGMVVAFVYVLLVEVLVSFVPAAINQLTVHFRLRTLFVNAFPPGHLIVPAHFQQQVGTGPAWHHVAVLIGYAAIFLAAGVLVLSRKQLVTTQEE